MREVFEIDLFAYPADAVCIPVNWTTKRDGTAVMGAGVAKQAAERWPWLPEGLGALIRRHELAVHAWDNSVASGPHVVCLPTKRHFRDPADPSLIEAMVRQLVWFVDAYGWQTVALPRLGCGERTGRLDWADVKPILERHLDDRFVVCTPEARP